MPNCILPGYHLPQCLFAKMFLPRQASWTKVFSSYFEDCEYCYRARKAGWDILHVPTAHMVHLHGQSSQVGTMITKAKRLPRYYYASRTRYFRLRYGVAGPTLANIGWCLGRLISKFRETFGSKMPHLPNSAWKDIWTNWVRPLSKARN